MSTRAIVFQKLPTTVAEIKPCNDPELVAAYAMAALAMYPLNPNESVAMLNLLRGPRPLSGFDQQFLKDCFRGKEYLIRSYFQGATPANNYAPSEPYTLVVETNPYTYTSPGYANFKLYSGGADSPRDLKLRQKPSTGEWFLWEYGGILSGIRIPVAADPWA